MNQKQASRATLSRLELRSPPLPQTLLEAVDLMDKPEQLEIGPVTQMVQRDPIVIARLLQIVNSAYYGLQRSVSSADRAVVMLGPVAVTGIVMGMNMLKLRSALDGPASTCFFHLIRHSLATAFLTRFIVEGPPRSSFHQERRATKHLGASFTAGLLHDFGKIILVFNFPHEAVELYEKQGVDLQIRDLDLRSMEQLLFGCDHIEAGEYVARKLDFPDTLTDVIRYQHEPTTPTGNAETDRLLNASAAANIAAKAMGFAFTSPLSRQECSQSSVWDHLITQNLPGRPTRSDLLADLFAQQEHLDEFVQNLTTPTMKAVHQQHPRSPLRAL